MLILFSAYFLLKCIDATRGAYSYTILHKEFARFENFTRFQDLREGWVLMVSYQQTVGWKFPNKQIDTWLKTKIYKCITYMHVWYTSQNTPEMNLVIPNICAPVMKKNKRTL